MRTTAAATGKKRRVRYQVVSTGEHPLDKSTTPRPQIKKNKKRGKNTFYKQQQKYRENARPTFAVKRPISDTSRDKKGTPEKKQCTAFAVRIKSNTVLRPRHVSHRLACSITRHDHLSAAPFNAGQLHTHPTVYFTSRLTLLKSSSSPPSLLPLLSTIVSFPVPLPSKRDATHPQYKPHHFHIYTPIFFSD